MKLLASTNSPFSRKVRVVFAEKKCEYTLVEQEPWDERSVVNEHNPLGKVPVLVLEDRTNLFDSRVIVEYVDLISPVQPVDSGDRATADLGQALGSAGRRTDGSCSRRHSEVTQPNRQQHPATMERHATKMRAAVQTMCKDLSDRLWCNGEAYSLADITTGVALEFLDYRHPDFD